MALQLPPFWPRRPQAVSSSEPTIPEVLVVLGEKRHANVLPKQLHSASLGVGGSVVLASQVEFCVGQAGKVVVPDALGLFGGEIWPY